MSDITNHKFVDGEILSVHAWPDWIEIDLNSSDVGFDKSDAIAISQHFYESLSQFERLEFINEIRSSEKSAICDGYSFKNIKQSETTHTTHYKGKGEMKRNDGSFRIKINCPR